MMASLMVFFSSHAQQRIDPKGMNYLAPLEPNTIIYHDTVFTGVRQFKPLFYRMNDPQLEIFFKKHQSNKVIGQILSFIGTVTTAVGIAELSDDHTSKGVAWTLIGGGFAVNLTGGYMMLMGRRNLATAVVLFNQRYSQASLGIGLSGNQAGLVYKF